MATLGTRISGVGLAHPSRLLTNADLSKLVETSDEWIRSRTGIGERRVVDPATGESNSSIALTASRQALSHAGVEADDIDFILSCTATPDTWMPNSACRISGALSKKRIPGVDVNAACSGFLYGLHMGDALVKSGIYKKILVIGSDVFTSFVDWTDRGTCVLFGDGVGAAILEPIENPDPKTDSMILGTAMFNLFDSAEHLAVKGGASRTPPTSPRYMKEERPYITMQGQEVFKAATRCMVDAANLLLDRCGVSKSELRWFIPHQANLRIIEMVAQLLHFPMERTYVNVERWGNTSAATVPICLAELHAKNLIKKGDLLLLDVFGGGFSYGAALVRW